MKKYFLLLLFVSTFSFSQEFNYDNNGLNPVYVVQEIDSLNQSELYLKTINWIKESFVDPDEVINTTIENEKIRFTGSKEKGICSENKTMLGKVKACFNVRYMIELAFKDGRYKFTPISLEYWTNALPQLGQQARWNDVNLLDGSIYYEKDGKIKKGLEQRILDIENIFINLNLSLKQYLLENQSVKDQEW